MPTRTPPASGVLPTAVPVPRRALIRLVKPVDELIVGNTGVMLEVGEEEFGRLVEEALDSIPPELGSLMSNVAVLVQDEPPDGQDLFGLYEGVPLTERDSWYSGVLPDTITIFRLPILRVCQTEDDVVDEVLTTVIHEVAHHFGIDDDALDEMGWG